MVIQELAVFVAYRRSDGGDIAGALFNHLHGRTFSSHPVRSIRVYHDLHVAAREDWRVQHREALETATSLIVVCSPDATRARDDDEFQAELQWWLRHRPDRPPILVAASVDDVRVVPDCIARRWPNAQIVPLSPTTSNRSLRQRPEERERSIQSILSALVLSLESAPTVLRPSGGLSSSILYHWTKDRFSRYVQCSENYAAAAGLDSPAAIVGKSDDRLAWRALASAFRQGDLDVMAGRAGLRFNVLEREIMVDRVADILVTETELRDHRGTCIGVTGHFVDVTGARLVQVPAVVSTPAPLPPQLQTLMPDELGILQHLLRRSLHQPEAIASAPSGHVRRALMATLRRKLQCRSNAEVVRLCLQWGMRPDAAYFAPSDAVSDSPRRRH